MRRTASAAVLLVASLANLPAPAETLRHPRPLEKQLKATELSHLAREARRRGDPQRGALVFFKSAAACSSCHASGEAASPLGPDLAELGKETTAEHVVESLLFPSRKIRKGYETVSVLTTDGRVLRGLVAERDAETVVLRDASDLEQEVSVPRDQIEAIRPGEKSMMPEGLIASLGGQRPFFDLAAYVLEVARGGPGRAAELKPSPEQLAVHDDSANLDHAGILQSLGRRDFETGQRIYHGYCFNCHGRDGNTPSLPTARAFGTEKLKFGADPYSMFMTLTRGNGLMGAMSHLTPKERYQVVHYIREAFMKGNNPDYEPVDQQYLASLPKGTEQGDSVPTVHRDYGPALASQLERRVNSALTIQLGGGMTISYDLHTMDQAGVWRGGFLDLSETQHMRGRGEGTAEPAAELIDRLGGWRWGHDGTLDYPQEDLLPRGPLPQRWLDYRGHYLHGDQVVLRYAIDGREILEHPQRSSVPGAVRHSLRIGPGEALVLSAARGDSAAAELSGAVTLNRGEPLDRQQPLGEPASASDSFALSAAVADGSLGDYTAAGVRGDTDGMSWSVDQRQRLILRIPADDEPRRVEVVCATGHGRASLASFQAAVSTPRQAPDPAELTGGGEPNWPDVLTTVGYPGLEQGAYQLDTLTIPKSTPWNTWFRTSALDFFPDGRMVVSTYGGDIWIVSGIDDQLLNLKWKRFAGGLYEPFGVKVVDGQIYVTCKDRLTRLHDLNGDGEADFYESFSADPDVSVNFHAFNFDLQVDSEGNFYYAKSGHGADFALPGAVYKISPDGEHREVYCTGFRTPNGMGMLPGDRLTASDNQGQWTPASKINLLEPGGFYGWVPTYGLEGMWAPDGGKIDTDQVEPPKAFDQPLIWMPQEFDNSSGGQLWAGDPRFGPLSGRLLHTSFGKGWMYYLMLQHFEDVSQAAIIKLPFNFRTGIMRARVNPADGQVYATGLDGWNGGARPDMRDKGIQRLRYTGKPHRMVTDCRVESDGLRIEFSFPLDAESATDLSSYVAEHWNYRWREAYGSDQYSPTTGKPGVEKLNVVAASVGADGKSVKLHVPDLKPVDQVHLLIRVKSRRGKPFAEEIYWTLNRVP